MAVKRGIIRMGSWSYRLTERDLLWAARMVQGETLPGRAGRRDDALAVLWTMTSLFSPDGQRAKYGRWRFDSFTDLIRAYSQPINPRWLAGGQFCRPGGRGHGRDECSPARLAARERLQRTPWPELDAELREVVLRWAAGHTTNPVPTAIEFAAPFVVRSFLARHPGAQLVATIHNQFVATADSARWPALPSIELEETAAGVHPAGAALFAAALGGLLGWGIARRRRRDRR